uniref:Putative secreted protein n=1 Tax=Anopheles darlingi TaxID=43151 RepID=A0A2M4DBU2_ANODA
MLSLRFIHTPSFDSIALATLLLLCSARGQLSSKHYSNEAKASFRDTIETTSTNSNNAYSTCACDRESVRFCGFRCFSVS